jgi:3-isopropylmalate/(R)-2-methylmalate dehydratase large subunit
MGSTIAEKILARTAGVDRVTPGESRPFRPDYMMAYDFPGYTDAMFRQMREDFGIDKVAEPERYVLFIDHMTHQPTEAEQAAHDVTRAWATHNGVRLHEDLGIGHQVAAELGYGLPGHFVIHFDGHISGLGAFGCLGLGVRRDLLEAWITGAIWLEVPATTRFELTGRFAPGVDSRDLIHRIIGDLGPAACRQQVMEYTGPGAEAMSLGRRQGLCAMAMFAGAVTAIFNPDDAALAYARRVARTPFEPLRSDPDARYAATHYDLSGIEPQVVLPGSPRHTARFRDVEGTPLDVGCIGSRASGCIEDRGPPPRCEGPPDRPAIRAPGRSDLRIMAQAQREGLIQTLSDAGAYIAGPSCDFCFGREEAEGGPEGHLDGRAEHLRAHGSPKAEIFMASAYTVAASALEGRVADPRKYGEGAGGGVSMGNPP